MPTSSDDHNGEIGVTFASFSSALATGTMPASAVRTTARNWTARESHAFDFLRCQYHAIALSASLSTYCSRRFSDSAGSWHVHSSAPGASGEMSLPPRCGCCRSLLSSSYIFFIATRERAAPCAATRAAAADRRASAARTRSRIRSRRDRSRRGTARPERTRRAP